MRYLTILPLCLVAACSDDAGEKQAADAPATIQAGQWETSLEVTGFRSTDRATPALKAAAGDKSTAQSCVEEGDTKKPEPELFVGPGYECDYKDSYIRGGRINATLKCERKALKGDIMMTVDGSYSGDSFQGIVTATSFLPGDGDFAMTSKVSGRRTAPACAPAAPAPAKR
jgi:hypothetical protein